MTDLTGSEPALGGSRSEWIMRPAELTLLSSRLSGVLRTVVVSHDHYAHLSHDARSVAGIHIVASSFVPEGQIFLVSSSPTPYPMFRLEWDSMSEEAWLALRARLLGRSFERRVLESDHSEEHNG